jgi:MFS family permease
MEEGEPMNASRKSFALFLVIWAGQLLSKIGGGISAFALGVHLLQTTGATSAYSFLLMAAFLPAALLAPAGGVIADRHDRMRVMAAGDLGSALGVLFIIGSLWARPSALWAIYLGAAVSSAFAALQAPAFKAAVTDWLDEAAYAKAGGLVQLAEASQFLLGPVLAAFLLSRFSLPQVLVIDMATFAAAGGIMLLVRNPMNREIGSCEIKSRQIRTREIRSREIRSRENQNRKMEHQDIQRPGIPASQMKNGGTELRMKTKRATVRFRDALTEGFRYLSGNPAVRHLLILTTAVTFLAGILQSLFVPLVLSVSGPKSAGIVQSISASGMLAGSLWIGLCGNSQNQRRILGAALFAAGVFYILIGASPTALWITAAAFGFFCTLPFVNSSLEVLFRQHIHNEMQGRAWSLISLISQTGLVVAFGIAGPLADHVFNPLVTGAGPWADTIGQVIGAGPSRGGGLMVMAFGAPLLLCALFSGRDGGNPAAAKSSQRGPEDGLPEFLHGAKPEPSQTVV